MNDLVPRQRDPKLVSPRVANAPVLTSRATPDVTAEPVASRGPEFALGSFADGLKAIAGATFPVLEEQRREEGAAAAWRDVNEGRFTKRPSFSIRDQAYNQAGLEALAGNVETESVRRVMELSRTHAGDPDGFIKSVTAHADGVSGELAGLSPQLAGTMRQRIMARATPFIERLGQQRATIVQGESEAARLRYEPQLNALLDDVAGDIFSGNAKLSGAAMSQVEALAGQYLAEMERIGPDGLPIYSEADRERARQNFFGRVVEEGLTKWFRETDDLGTAVLEFMNGDLQLAYGDGQMMDVSAMLDPKARLRVLQRAQAELADRNQTLEAAERAREKQAGEAQNAAFALSTDRMIRGQLSPQDVRGMISRGEVDPRDGASLLLALEKRSEPKPPETDPIAARNIVDMIYNTSQGANPENLRRALSYISSNINRFTQADAEKYYAMASAKFGTDDSPINSVEARRQERLLREEIGAVESIMATRGFGDPVAARLTSAVDEYYERVMGGEDPRAVRLDIAPRAKGPDAPPPSSDTLLEPRFAVRHPSGHPQAGRIDIAATAGALTASGLSGEELARQSALLRQWDMVYKAEDAENNAKR